MKYIILVVIGWFLYNRFKGNNQVTSSVNDAVSNIGTASTNIIEVFEKKNNPTVIQRVQTSVKLTIDAFKGITLNGDQKRKDFLKSMSLIWSDEEFKYFESVYFKTRGRSFDSDRKRELWLKREVIDQVNTEFKNRGMYTQIV